MFCDITRIYSGKIWGKEQPGDRGGRDQGDLWETGRAGNRNGKSYWSCQQLCTLQNGNSKDYYLLAAVLKNVSNWQRAEKAFPFFSAADLVAFFFFFNSPPEFSFLTSFWLFLRPILGTVDGAHTEQLSKGHSKNIGAFQGPHTFKMFPSYPWKTFVKYEFQYMKLPENTANITHKLSQE